MVRTELHSHMLLQRPKFLYPTSLPAAMSSVKENYILVDGFVLPVDRELYNPLISSSIMGQSLQNFSVFTKMEIYNNFSETYCETHIACTKVLRLSPNAFDRLETYGVQ